ncbi:MFS transporter [Acerihabitans sp. TG2]|uniref:MFS transporter n=1 Tax=Acerihabitans sp. TG2 TaxID=3096008 RepID=UPI002B2225DE|nr:MFS transporter [Acerihabitans sp. TG2]MEA9391425.1 MFS transporter [Acerihabitans sp. TG2]
MKTKTDHPSLSPALIIVMAIATGLSVASNYYAQPLLETIAQSYHLSVNQAGFIVTAAQLGYACGLMFIVPLGDKFERRSMIVIMTLLSAAGLLVTASSGSLWMMILGTAMTGLFSVVAQILVPLAATLADPAKRGKVVGMIMSGLLLGILLARTVSGALATMGGWRTVYWFASALMIIMALILWLALPRYKQYSDLNYPQLLISIFRIYFATPMLRTRALIGCVSFASFSNLWTSMAFLLAAGPFHFSEAKIGLFGLVGAAGALIASRAGQLADRGKAKTTTRYGLLLLLVSWAFIWYGQYQIISLIIGIIFLDMAVQGVHITNQSVIYRRMPQARNRLTSGYMTSYFVGGALGSLISASAFSMAGWTGVCVAGGILGLLNLLIWLRGQHYEDNGVTA